MVNKCVEKRLLVATTYTTTYFTRETKWLTIGFVADVVCPTTEHGIVNIVVERDVTTVAELQPDKAFIVCNYNGIYDDCDGKCEKCKYFPKMRLVSLADLNKEYVPIS